MDNNTSKSLGLGEYLRSEREKRAISIEQVASATKINLKLLQSLESDDYEALPAKPFVRGFVTSYAKYLGLNAEEILVQYDSYLDEKTARKFRRPEDAPHIFVDKEDSAERSKMILKIVMVGFVLAGIILVLIFKPSLKHKKNRSKNAQTIADSTQATPTQSPSSSLISPLTPETDQKETELKKEDGKKPEPEKSGAPSPSASPSASPTPKPTPTVSPTPKSSPSPSASPTPKPTPTVSPTPKPTPTVSPTPKPSPSPSASPTPKPTPEPSKTTEVAKKEEAKKDPYSIPANEVKVKLVIRAIDNSWVKYQSDSNPIKQYTLKKDQKIYVKGRESVRFSSGNGKALEYSYDGYTFKPYPVGKVIVLPVELESKFAENPFVEVSKEVPTSPATGN